jgi:hypothetical protein
MQLERAAELTEERIKTLENPSASSTELNGIRHKQKQGDSSCLYHKQCGLLLGSHAMFHNCMWTQAVLVLSRIYQTFLPDVGFS